MNGGELKLKSELLAAKPDDRVAVHSLELCEVASHNKDGPLRQLLHMAEKSLEHVISIIETSSRKITSNN